MADEALLMFTVDLLTFNTMKQLKIMHYIVYYSQDQKSRNLMYIIIPSFAH